MATLIPALGSAAFDSSGERRLAERLEQKLDDDYPKSAISDIHQRIDGEIHPKQVRRTLEELTAKGSVRFEDDKRWRRYWAVPQ